VVSYLTFARDAEAEIEVKRSRFLCTIARVDTEDAARAVVERLRKQHWDARHHCFGLRIRQGRLHPEVERSSDDGEPAGTAGAPMLEVLRGREVSDVVAVVTRWFGGTLLGTGGLIRAYGDAVSAALDAATPLTFARRDGLVVTVGSADAPRVENALRGHPGCAVTSTTWGATGLVLELAVDPGTGESVRGLVGALTAGEGEVTGGRGSWVAVPQA
jgi:putative IMPACT (imprinted ancient) family translation regulator